MLAKTPYNAQALIMIMLVMKNAANEVACASFPGSTAETTRRNTMSIGGTAMA